MCGKLHSYRYTPYVKSLEIGFQSASCKTAVITGLFNTHHGRSLTQVPKELALGQAVEGSASTERFPISHRVILYLGTMSRGWDDILPGLFSLFSTLGHLCESLSLDIALNSAVDKYQSP